MWNLFRKAKPEVPEMAQGDKEIIQRFAAGDDILRNQAIMIHRDYITIIGSHGSPEQNFMSEIDTSATDLRLREHYRKVLLTQDKS